MKPILSAFVLVSLATFGHAASADTRDAFVCKTANVIEGSEKTEIRFVVSNLNGAQPAVETDSELGTTEEYPFATKPRSSVLDLSDNWTFKIKSGKLTVTSDGDGCQWTTFVLYENSGFKKGYVQVKGDSGCGAGNFYSEVSCRITSR